MYTCIDQYNEQNENTDGKSMSVDDNTNTLMARINPEHMLYIYLVSDSPRRELVMF